MTNDKLIFSNIFHYLIDKYDIFQVIQILFQYLYSHIFIYTAFHYLFFQNQC